jgi:hypothetical protein
MPNKPQPEIFVGRSNELERIGRFLSDDEGSALNDEADLLRPEVLMRERLSLASFHGR